MITGLLQFLVRFYQGALSPVLHFLGGPGCGCRFEPSCSQYCLEALQLHGACKGSWLGVRRLARCHPWGGAGMDPVPAVFRSVRGRPNGEGCCGSAETFKHY